MKNILITGANSYIGTSFENYLKNFGDAYSVSTIDMIDGSWRAADFSKYDAVFHVAAIVHKKETKENQPLYYSINRDLVVEVAEKAKKEGVKQFVFLSSMSVYGLNSGKISLETEPTPSTNYGKSKLQAEQKIQTMNSTDFCVSVLRPPMIYGKGCKGNFPRLIGLAKKLPIFPNVRNERSMLYIENLCEFLRQIIDRQLGGVLFPQNTDYVCTTDLVRTAMTALGKKQLYTRIFNPLISLAKPLVGAVNKMFGNLTYDQTMSAYDFDYNVVPFTTGIEKSIEK